MHETDQRIERATAQASHHWAALYGDDPLLGSVPGMGPTTAPTVRAFLGDACRFDTAKAAASYVGMNPSWSSGTVVQPSRAITKEGRPCSGWRSTKPPAAPARRPPGGRLLPPPHGRPRTRATKANVAVARKAHRADLDGAEPRRAYRNRTSTARP